MRFSRRNDDEFEETDEQAPLVAPVAETDVKVQNEIYADTSVEPDEPAASRWLRAVISLIVLALILIALFLGGRWIYNTLFNDKPSTPAQISGPGTAPGSNPAQDQKDKTKSGSNSTTSTTTERSNSPAQSTPTPTTASTPTTGGELPDSGPGSVLAVFAGVSLAAAGLHYIVTQRRSA